MDEKLSTIVCIDRQDGAFRDARKPAVSDQRGAYSNFCFRCVSAHLFLLCIYGFENCGLDCLYDLQQTGAVRCHDFAKGGFTVAA
jgi:hypothetical protein